MFHSVNATELSFCRVVFSIWEESPTGFPKTAEAPPCRKPSRPASDTKGERFPSGRSSQLGHVITGRLDKWPCHLFPPAAGITALTSTAQAWWQFHMTTLNHTEHSVGIQFISLTDLFPIAGRL